MCVCVSVFFFIKRVPYINFRPHKTWIHPGSHYCGSLRLLSLENQVVSEHTVHTQILRRGHSGVKTDPILI